MKKVLLVLMIALSAAAAHAAPQTALIERALSRTAVEGFLGSRSGGAMINRILADPAMRAELEKIRIESGADRNAITERSARSQVENLIASMYSENSNPALRNRMTNLANKADENFSRLAAEERGLNQGSVVSTDTAAMEQAQATAARFKQLQAKASELGVDAQLIRALRVQGRSHPESIPQIVSENCLDMSKGELAAYIKMNIESCQAGSCSRLLPEIYKNNFPKGNKAGASAEDAVVKLDTACFRRI